MRGRMNTSKKLSCFLLVVSIFQGVGETSVCYLESVILVALDGETFQFL